MRKCLQDASLSRASSAGFAGYSQRSDADQAKLGIAGEARHLYTFVPHRIQLH